MRRIDDYRITIRRKRSIFALVLALLLLMLFLSGCRLGSATGGLPGPAVEAGPAQPSQPVPMPTSVTLNAVGDVMLARHVGTLMLERGAGYPLARLGSDFADADISFCNLESPISSQGKSLPGKGICFRARPEVIPVFQQGGVDVVSLANNHAVDYDTPALLQTVELLAEKQVAAVGAGKNLEAARRPVILERQGQRIAFLAYSDLADYCFSSSYCRRHRAEQDLAGVAPLDSAAIEQDIAAIRPEVDQVVVSLHWGQEYRANPTLAQRELAHRLVEVGADCIIGHHPHWFQGLEVYQGKLIAYSLGNFVFDQNWSAETREGLFLRLEWDADGTWRAKVRPVWIENSQPVWAAGSQAQELRRRVMNLSEKLGTTSAEAGEWITYGP